jgi:hypothetical protein
MLYSGAALAGKPANATGFTPIYPREELANNEGVAGAVIWSDHGCTINVGLFVGAVVAGGF